MKQQSRQDSAGGSFKDSFKVTIFGIESQEIASDKNIFMVKDVFIGG